MIIKNRDRRYPIRGVSDEIDGVSYRTGTKGWMECVVVPLLQQEFCAMKPLQKDRKRVLFVDNYGGHKEPRHVARALESFKTELRYFLKNATDLVHPCDLVVIQKIKAV